MITININKEQYLVHVNDITDTVQEYIHLSATFI